MAVPPLIVAHRGASFDAPENTLAAFTLGVEQGADAIEGDYFLSGDGQIVCMHDDTTARTTGGKVSLMIADAPSSELRVLEVGAWKADKFAGERVPLLEEVLAALPVDTIKYIEIKCGPEIVPELKRVITASRKPPKHLRVISFNADVIAECKVAMPSIKAYWLTGYERDKKTGNSVPTPDEVIATLKRCRADGLGTRADMGVLTSAFVKKLRDSNFEFHAWTVDDPAIAKQLVKLGVDSITTNKPGWLREQLNDVLGKSK